MTDSGKVCHFIVENYAQQASARELQIVKTEEMVIVDSWSADVELDLKEYQNKVTVDAACGSAVLRGAHVFAPGIMSMPQGQRAPIKFLQYNEYGQTI